MLSLQLVLPGLLAIPGGLQAQFAAPAVLEVNPDSSSIPVWQFQYKVGGKVAGMAGCRYWDMRPSPRHSTRQIAAASVLNIKR